MQGIVKLLQKLKPAKSAGLDNIPTTRILKEYALHIAPVLQVIYLYTILPNRYITK